MMFCGGIASSYLGYLMGQEALKAVTQPEVNSEDKINRQKPVGGDYKGLKILNEKEILVKVYDRMNDREEENQPESLSQTEGVDLVDEDSQSNSIDSRFFPIATQTRGVTLKISHAEFQGSSLLLGLNLRNDSQREVSFLYSFLDIRDDRGKSLSAIPNGLPGTIPANSENFQGSLKIPTVLLANSKTISLSLSDYPQQDIELKLPQIPIVR
jgi:hypothetical protein